MRPDKPRVRFPATRADQMLTMQGLDRYKHLLAFVTDAEKRSLLAPEFARAVGESRTSEFLAGPWRQAAGADILNRYLYVDLRTFLAEDILFKVDVTSMASSLECRSPFLDHKLIEFAFSLPGSYKATARGRHKHILKEAFGSWLPPGFMDRPK